MSTIPESSNEDRALTAAQRAFDNRYDGTNHESSLDDAARAAYRQGIADGLAAARDLLGVGEFE